MKTLFTSLLALFFAPVLFAQTSHTIQKATPRPAYMAPPVEKTAGIVDTIFDYFDRSTDFFLLTAGTAGYTLGTNSFTEETAVHYDGIGVLKVTEIAVFVSEIEVIGTADTLEVRAYSVDTDTLPVTTMGIGRVSVSNLDTSGFATFFPMSILDSTSGGFLLSVDYGAIDDSIAILSNNVLSSNNGPDGNGEKRTRQLITNSGWLPVMDIWTFNGVPMDADAMILPVIDYTQPLAVVPSISAGNLSLSAPFPQPATDRVSLPFQLNTPAAVQLDLFDIQGRPIQTVPAQNFSAGDQFFDLDTQQIPAGHYYFRMVTDDGALMGKFVVQK